MAHTEPADFVISHASADQPMAEWIAGQLKAAGYTSRRRAWDFPPGGELLAELEAARDDGERVLAVLSPAYLATEPARTQWRAAVAADLDYVVTLSVYREKAKSRGRTGLAAELERAKWRLLAVRVAEGDLADLDRPLVYVDLVGLTMPAAAQRLLAGVFRLRNPLAAARGSGDLPDDLARDAARDAARAALTRLLSHEDPQVVVDAAGLLADLDPELIKRTLTRLLHRHRHDRQGWAATLRLISRMDVISHLDPLIRMLDSDDPQVVREGLSLISRMDDVISELAPLTASMLDSDDPQQVVRAALKVPAGPDPGAVQAALARLLSHDDPQVVVDAAGLLADLDPDAALAALARLVSHDDPQVVVDAAGLLADLDPDAALAALARLLDHHDPLVVRAAAERLARLDPDGIQAVLARLLDHHDPQMVLDAAQRLARLDPDGTATALSDLLDSDDPKVARLREDARSQELLAYLAYARGGPPGGVARHDRDDRISVHAQAHMDPALTVEQVSTVQVIVAREPLWRAIRPTEVGGHATAAPDQPLVVEVLPRANLEALGDTQAKLPVPLPGQPALLLFEVRATHPGPGELWVLVRQDQLTLLTLVLRPHITPTATAASAADREGDQRAPQGSGRAIVGGPAGPLTMLRIVEQRRGDAVVFRYDLDAPDLGLLRAYASPLIEQPRDAYVRGLFARIERAWLDTDRDVEAFQAELRAFGGTLLDELVPVGLQRDLWEHRNRLTHVVVVSTEPFIPWELVHLKPPGARTLPAETRFLAQLGLVRWLLDPHSTRPPERLLLRPDRARFVIPDYSDPTCQLPETASERAFLQSRLAATPVVPHHREVLALLDEAGGPDGFDLLHFAGHGLAASDDIADAQILLEGRAGAGQYVREPLRATTVTQHFHTNRQTARIGRTHDGNRRPMVVLNACQTGRLGYQLASIGGFAEAFVGGGAGAFISSLWSVGDTPARTFVQALYEALLDGHPMARAVRAAREGARTAGDATWLAYTIYAHPNATLEHVPAAQPAPPA